VRKALACVVACIAVTIGFCGIALGLSSVAGADTGPYEYVALASDVSPGTAVTDYFDIFEPTGYSDPNIPVTGTLTYSVYGPSGSTTCPAADSLGSPIASWTTNMDTPQLAPTSGSFVAENTGDYFWTIAYTGDPAANAPAVYSCNIEDVQGYTYAYNNLSGAGGENLPLSVTQGTAVTNTALVYGDGTHALTGTVNYTLWPWANCSEGQVGLGGPNVTKYYTEQITTPGVIPSSPAFTAPATGDYSWEANYDGDVYNETSSAPCTNEIMTAAPTPPPPPLTGTLTATANSNTEATATWTNFTPVSIGRDGTDSTGTGSWSTTTIVGNSQSFTFLIPGDQYTITATDAAGQGLTATLTMPGKPAAPTPPAPTPISTPTPTPTPIGSTPPTPPVVTSPTTTTTTTTTGHGYWLVGSDGGIFTEGNAQFYGSTGNLRLQRPVVGITPTTDRAGYWLVASDGGIFSFGDTQFYGSIPGIGLHPAGSGLPNSLNAPIVGMVPSADGHGYFLVASDGGVFAFGDAKFEGSCPGIGGCSGSAVAVMPDASGNGYWLVTNTGSIYTFGDAQYFGAPGNVGSPVTSAVRTPDGGGYWILLADGVVASYGDAASLGGPAGHVGGANPATAIFATTDGAGYWVASYDGEVFTMGDAPYLGGVSNLRLNGGIIAATGW
jgi:hypothetical protein